MDKTNELTYFDGDEAIEAEGYLSLSFAVRLDSAFKNRSREAVAMELLRAVLDGDMQEVSLIDYRITGP